MKPLKQETPPKKITSERLVLQSYRLELAETMFEYVVKDRKRLARFLPWPNSMKTVQDEIRYIKSMQKARRGFQNFDFCIFRKSDGIYMGNIGAHSIQWDQHRCELGYWILGDFEGNDYVSEAVRALEIALFKVGFNRIEIRCNTRNARSARVPRSCGYMHEGTLRQDGIDLGKFRDTMIFGKLKREWK